MTQRNSRRHAIVALSALITGSVHAAPIEGELGTNLAALLLLLGIGALLMGIRNLRELRHKRMVLNRGAPRAGARLTKGRGAKTR